MTKYLNKEGFSSPANNKNYNDNYDRTFCKHEEHHLEDGTDSKLARLVCDLCGAEGFTAKLLAPEDDG